MKPVLITLTLSLSLFLSACGDEEQQVQEDAPKPVKYATVSHAGGAEERTFNGTAQSGAETNLSFRANGLILKLMPKVGDRVSQGQLLARLDQKDVLLSYEQAKAGLQNAKIQLETATSSLERTKQLYQSNNASLGDYEQAKSGFANAQSTYETAKKSLDLQASQLEYTLIKAPTDGVVTAVNAEVNEFAQAGSPVIVMSSGEDDIEINVGVPEKYITQLHRGDDVNISFPSLKGSAFAGTITEVGFSAGGGSTFPVTVKVLEPSGDIRPGMPADVNFRFGDANEEAVLVVPVKAVGEGPDGNFVFVLKDEEGITAHKTLIEIGPLTAEGFKVVSGVNDGDLVAIAGLRSLYDGMKVSLLDL